MNKRPSRPGRPSRIAAGLIGALLITVATGALAVERKTLETDVPPEMRDGRVFVPLRAAGTALGAKVDWKAAEQTVEMTNAGHRVVLTVGQTSATVDNQPRTMDSPPYLKNGRVLVPLRFAGDALQVPVRPTRGNKSILIGPGGTDRTIWELHMP